MEEKGFDMNDDLLVKYLAGEVTAEEEEAILLWLDEGKENERYFNDFRTIWEESERLACKSQRDENAAWERFRERTILKPAAPRAIRPFSHLLRIAAVVILLCIMGGIAVSVFLQSREVRVVEVQTRQGTRTDTLPDGSVITLNRGSKLSYPSRFAGEKRRVKMDGEAFFKIAPDRKKPFIIQVNNVTVTVLGTSFNIKSRNGRTEVIVKTGLIRVTREHDQVEIKAGEKVIAEKQGTLIKKVNTNTVFDAYLDKTFICRNTPLPELIDAVNSAYGSEIRIENKDLELINVNTTFKNESLEKILKVLSATHNIKIEREAGQITLK